MSVCRQCQFHLPHAVSDYRIDIVSQFVDLIDDKINLKFYPNLWSRSCKDPNVLQFSNLHLIFANIF